MCSTTGLQPRVKCVYVCSLAAFLYFVIFCGLVSCTFDLYSKSTIIHKIPISKLLFSIIIVEVVVKRIVCTLFHSHMRQSREFESKKKTFTLKARHQNESCPGYECISRVPISCHTHKCVRSQIQIILVKLMNESITVPE